MPQLKIVEAVQNALDLALEKDDKVIVYGEDVGKEGGVFRATTKLQEKYGADRVVDAPLTEAGILGTAVGMSVAGMKPVVEIQFSGFIWPGYDHIINHLSRMRTRSQGRFTCPAVIRFPAGGGIHALEHHSESMEGAFAHTPGVKVVYPSGPYDTKGLLLAAIEDPDPVIFMEPERLYRAIKEEVPEEYYTLPLGEAVIEKEGKDLTVISYGPMLWNTKKVLNEYLKEKDVDIELINLRTISPLDTNTILNSVKKTGRCVIITEEPKSFGVAAEIMATIQEKALMSLKAPVNRVTGFDAIMPLLETEDLYIPTKERIINGIEKTLNF